MTETSAYRITGVDFVAVPAEDFEASVHFYGTVLGLPPGKRWGDMPGAEFQAGNLTLAVMQPTAFGQEFRPHSVPVALQVENVADARTHLEAQGVRFVTDMIDSGVCHQAIFLDPAGNALSLHHRYAPNPDRSWARLIGCSAGASRGRTSRRPIPLETGPWDWPLRPCPRY